ncbi:C40 family peptidase [Nocardiopsis kunsanensis]|uniref:C40 family peptidase n=1 Tax=Nocardiopsis kunsanensis TaxID=141693 RepID=UPI0003496755|nr:C40 family peptidase [Nocardiopsis kunsanensis]
MSASHSGRNRRTAVIASLTAGAFLLPHGVAHAEPTAEDVREEIEGLQEEFSSLNAEYNDAQETHEAAEERLEEVRSDIESAEEQVEDLASGVRRLANLSYSGVDYTSPTQLIGSDGPETAMNHQADLAYLASQNDETLEHYTEELEHLEALESEASDTEEEAASALEDAEEATESAEESIAEQEALLEELTEEERAEATETVGDGGSGGGGGGDYNGPASGNARTALDFAYAQIGKPYVWGGTGPNGYDCSGLTQAAWSAAGVSLPRTTYDQINAGTRVSWENKQAGDLLFFYGAQPSHVGMYAGNGEMVHASTSGTPIGTVTLNDYYRQEFVGAVRP